MTALTANYGQRPANQPCSLSRNSFGKASLLSEMAWRCPLSHACLITSNLAPWLRVIHHEESPAILERQPIPQPVHLTAAAFKLLR